MQLYDKLNELAALLKESREVKEYTELKQKIERNEADKSMFAEYRKLRFEVQSAYLSGGLPDEVRLAKLNKLGEVLQFNTDIAAFLSAEYRLNKMVGDIYRIIGDAVGLDIGFLQE